MFPSRNHQDISRFWLHGLMKGYCAAAGIPAEKAHMHALKQSCGTQLSARDADIVAIQDHMGHASIGNTMKYVSIASKRRDEFAERLDGLALILSQVSPRTQQNKYSVEFGSQDHSTQNTQSDDLR
jgi:integrase